MLVQELFGAHIQKKISTKLKRFDDGQLGGNKTHIFHMLALLKCKIN